MEISELGLISLNGSELPKAGSPEVEKLTSTSLSSQAGARSAYDGRTSTKWVHQGALPAVWMVRFRNPVAVKAYWWSTGEGPPGWDPISWSLSASVDGRKWFRLHSICKVPTTRQRSMLV